MTSEDSAISHSSDQWTEKGDQLIGSEAEVGRKPVQSPKPAGPRYPAKCLSQTCLQQALPLKCPQPMGELGPHTSPILAARGAGRKAVQSGCCTLSAAASASGVTWPAFPAERRKEKADSILTRSNCLPAAWEREMASFCQNSAFWRLLGSSSRGEWLLLAGPVG